MACSVASREPRTGRGFTFASIDRARVIDARNERGRLNARFRACIPVVAFARDRRDERDKSMQRIARARQQSGRARMTLPSCAARSCVATTLETTMKAIGLVLCAAVAMMGCDEPKASGDSDAAPKATTSTTASAPATASAASASASATTTASAVTSASATDAAAPSAKTDAAAPSAKADAAPPATKK
jgi:hypothetical protein